MNRRNITHTIKESVFAEFAKASFPNHNWIVIKTGPNVSGDSVHGEFYIPQELSKLESALLETDIWVIHRLNVEFLPVMKAFKARGKKIVIQTWGPDYLHHTGRYPLDVLEPQTLRWWKKAYEHTGLKRIYREAIVWRMWQKQVLECLRMADSVHHCLPSETCNRAEILESSHRFIYKDWTTAEFQQNKEYDYRSVILGNSGDPTNNHLDAISQLAKFSSTINRVLIPLSYGGDDEYADQVQAFANDVFTPSKVVTLKKWLPLDEYERLTSQYGTVLLYHRRQQGAGNFALALKQNKNVILHSDGLLQAWTKSNGLDFSELEFSAPRYKDEQKKKLLKFFSMSTSNQFMKFLSTEL